MWLALPVAIVSDWAVLALAAGFAAGWFAIKASAMQYLGAAIILSLPGTVLQLLAVPMTVLGIEKRVPRLHPIKRGGGG